MQRIIRDYPVFSILLLLLACIRFEYNATTWSVNVPGLAGGLAVLGVIAVVLFFRIFNAVQDICIAKNLLSERLRFKYDILMLVSILAAGMGFRYLGPLTQGMAGHEVNQWVFQWSDSQLNVYFVGLVILVVFLLRVLTLERAIAKGPRLGSG